MLINLRISSYLVILSDYLINSTSLLACAQTEFHSSGLSIKEEQANKKLTFKASDFNILLSISFPGEEMEFSSYIYFIFFDNLLTFNIKGCINSNGSSIELILSQSYGVKFALADTAIVSFILAQL